MARRTIGIHEKLPFLESLPLSFQHLTAMFGATILVPILNQKLIMVVDVSESPPKGGAIITHKAKNISMTKVSV